MNSSEKVLICIYPMVEDKDYNINFFLLEVYNLRSCSASFRGLYLVPRNRLFSCTGISCPPNTLGNFFECFPLQYVLFQNYIPVIDLQIMLQTSRDLSLNNSVSGSLYIHNNQYTINSSLIL